jgi:MFS transporter, DHA1 family, inner membrane transport protein
MRKPLLALAVAAFGIGTSEFIIMGLLPDLAHSFRVSIPKTGILVSGYALSVTFGSPLVALALSRMDRKRALLILMGIFLVGNGLCALAPTFLLLLLARILTALCHGAFFGIGSIAASHMAPRSKRAHAISLMFSGLTLATVLGVPAGTALGQAFGWRFAFWALIPIGLIAGLGLLRFLPSQPAEPMHIKHELHAALRPQVQLVLTLSTLFSVSLFCVFTYIAPILEQVTHLSPLTVTRVLVVFGVGITLGNLIGGRLGDWKQMPVMIVGIVALILIVATMPLFEPRVVPAMVMVFVWGCVHFAAGAPLQVRIVDQAKGAPHLASTLNQSAGNLGNALGANLGGIMLTEGVSYRYLSWGSAAVAAAALLVAIIALRVEQHQHGSQSGFVEEHEEENVEKNKMVLA